MMGVNVVELDKMIKNNSIKIDDINDAINSFKISILELRKSVANPQLNFLTSKLCSEVLELSKISRKSNAYNVLLKNVLNGYKYQEQAIAVAVSRQAFKN